MRETEFDVDLERVLYTGNESLLIHVWTNLIDNAVKYGPQQGLVTMRLTQEKETIRFVIEDQGSGIAPEDQTHIFDRFYQADSSRKAEGNGLGLALVKHILAVSDGTIEMENREEGGSRFIVELKSRRKNG